MDTESAGLLEIPFFGPARAQSDLADELLAVSRRILESGASLQSRDVADFERSIASRADRAHGIAVGSATDGLFFALKTLGIGPGDQVLVPALSFVASASAILRAGAVPVFVDVDDAGQIDLAAAQTALTPATRALLAVHLYGNMLDPAALRDFASAHGLRVIEDAAQAFGAAHGATPAGKMGDISVFSFDPTKVLGAPGSGGMVVTDDADHAERVRALRYHGKLGSAFTELGYNSQMPSLVAGMLNVKLTRHDEWTASRQRVAARYDAALASTPASLPDIAPAVEHARHKYTFRLEGRDELAAHLKARGVPTRIHYASILPDEPMFRETGPAGRNSDFPTARAITRETLSLPIHAYLSERELARVTDALRDYFA